MFGRRTQQSVPPENQASLDGQIDEMIEQQLRRRGVVMHSVLEAMRAVPRHLFVSHEYSHRAYADEALPTQEGQTISQPYMVAIMTQELGVRPGHRILELGTGSGYQTAVLAWLAGPEGQVYTIERVAALSDFAQRRLSSMDVRNVRFLVADGTNGWPADDPDWNGPRSENRQPLFDRILVTAGAPEVPKPLFHQLAEDGILVVPVGSAESQTLVKVERHGNEARTTELLDCRFVPLVGAHGWDEAQVKAARG
jgi:protein-L-isoaspartate(D-aspartate) O-methyltransferase